MTDRESIVSAPSTRRWPTSKITTSSSLKIKWISNKENKIISQEDVIKYVGISRDYNFFEFQDSLIDKDTIKFAKITQYFTSNETKFPFQQLLIYMFSFYSKLLIIKNNNLNNPQSIAAKLNIHPFVAKSYHRASNKYSID